MATTAWPHVKMSASLEAQLVEELQNAKAKNDLPATGVKSEAIFFVLVFDEDGNHSVWMPKKWNADGYTEPTKYDPRLVDGDATKFEGSWSLSVACNIANAAVTTGAAWYGPKPGGGFGWWGIDPAPEVEKLASTEPECIAVA